MRLMSGCRVGRSSHQLRCAPGCFAGRGAIAAANSRARSVDVMAAAAKRARHAGLDRRRTARRSRPSIRPRCRSMPRTLPGSSDRLLVGGPSQANSQTSRPRWIASSARTPKTWWLAGRTWPEGNFPERAALNLIGGRFLTDFYAMVAEWRFGRPRSWRPDPTTRAACLLIWPSGRPRCR